MERLGIIAGNGELPLAAASAARKNGVKSLIAVAFRGETQEQIANVVDEVVWLKVGQLEKLIQAFTSRGVDQCIMVGQIAPKNLFANVRPDLRMVSLLARLKAKNAETIFGAVADELNKEGVRLIDATPFLKELMPAAGVLTKQQPTVEQRSDIAFGLKIAKAISGFDIGQTVVVKDGVVLAVEAWEGTDDCLRRGGRLAGKGGGAVAVKVSKPNQDMRFDIPTIGPETIGVCREAGIAALAIEANHTLLLEKELSLAQADKNRIVVMAVL